MAPLSAGIRPLLRTAQREDLTGASRSGVAPGRDHSGNVGAIRRNLQPVVTHGDMAQGEVINDIELRSHAEAGIEIPCFA